MKKIAIILGALTLMITGCQSVNKTIQGTGIGAAAGGALGAAIYKKDRKKGALIGGALGGLTGGVIGRKLDLQAKELARVAETRRTEQGILTRMKGDMTFNSGAATLASSNISNVSEACGILAKYPENRIVIVGHTDSIPGKNVSNQQLSENRANSVRDLCISKGVPATAITVMGKGSNEPVGDNATREGRAMNRRVDLNISMVPSEG